MGNIITKDPDTIHWESNKNNSNQLTNDAKTLLGLLPDKLDASSEKPTQLEPMKVSTLQSNFINSREPKFNGLSDTSSIIKNIKYISKPIDLNTSTDSKQLAESIGLMDSKQFAQSIPSKEFRQTGGNRMLDTADLSDTSPFISSDMYNNLIQAGGAKSTKGIQPYKNADGDDSSTSSTSSSDDETDKKKNKNKKNKSDKTTDSVEVTEDSNNSNLSYVSSSAHTGGGSSSESETHTDSNNSNNSNKSTEESLNVHESPEKHESSEKHESPEIKDSEVIGYSENSPKSNETTPVTSPIKKSKKKDAKKSKDDSSSSSTEKNDSEENKSVAESIPKVSVEEDSIENKNSNLPPSEINTSAIEMVSAS
jgi:hypothetical protein